MSDKETLEYCASILISEKRKIIGDLDRIKFFRENISPMRSNVGEQLFVELNNSLHEEREKIDAAYTKVYNKIQSMAAKESPLNDNKEGA